MNEKIVFNTQIVLPPPPTAEKKHLNQAGDPLLCPASEDAVWAAAGVRMRGPIVHS